MKYLALGALLILVAPTNAVPAEPSARLEVSVTIPPRPCDYEAKEDCDNAQQAVVTGLSTAIIGKTRIRYVGSRPEIAEKDDVLIVLF